MEKEHIVGRQDKIGRTDARGLGKKTSDDGKIGMIPIIPVFLPPKHAFPREIRSGSFCHANVWPASVPLVLFCVLRRIEEARDAEAVEKAKPQPAPFVMQPLPIEKFPEKQQPRGES